MSRSFCKQAVLFSWLCVVIFTYVDKKFGPHLVKTFPCMTELLESRCTTICREIEGSSVVGAIMRPVSAIVLKYHAKMTYSRHGLAKA